MLQFLNETIDWILSKSKPFKVEVELVLIHRDTCVVLFENERKIIDQRYCYFVPGHQKPGDKVMVDRRYLRSLPSLNS